MFTQHFPEIYPILPKTRSNSHSSPLEFLIWILELGIWKPITTWDLNLGAMNQCKFESKQFDFRFQCSGCFTWAKNLNIQPYALSHSDKPTKCALYTIQALNLKA